MVTVRNSIDTRMAFVDASKTIIDGVQEMLRNQTWSFVVTKGSLPVGVVTDRDIIRRCLGKGMDPNRTPVERIMSSPLITIGPDQPLAEALDLMAKNNIKRVYVVEGGKIIGKVTQTEAFRRLLNLVMGLQSVPRAL